MQRKCERNHFFIFIAFGNLDDVHVVCRSVDVVVVASASADAAAACIFKEVTIIGLDILVSVVERYIGRLPIYRKTGLIRKVPQHHQLIKYFFAIFLFFFISLFFQRLDTDVAIHFEAQYQKDRLTGLGSNFWYSGRF